MEREYTFTSFLPSGNPFDWYFDDKKNAAFITSLDTEKWASEPQKGDKVKLIRNDNTYTLEQAFINNRMVYNIKK